LRPSRYWAIDAGVSWIFFLVLFGLIVGVGYPRAYAASCGTIKNFFADGRDLASYKHYGSSGNAYTFGAVLCGSSTGEGSAVAKGQTIEFSNGDWEQVGYYNGCSAVNCAHWTGSNAGGDYFWDKQQSGTYYFCDISYGTSVNGACSGGTNLYPTQANTYQYFSTRTA
jgi:hypothetical protein